MAEGGAGGPARGRMTLEALVALLVCPGCRGELERELDDRAAICGLICRPCGRRYPVIDGVPRLVLEESAPLRAR